MTVPPTVDVASSVLPSGLGVPSLILDLFQDCSFLEPLRLPKTLWVKMVVEVVAGAEATVVMVNSLRLCSCHALEVPPLH